MTSLDEFTLIRRYFTPSALPPHIVAGVGDDCALLTLPAGCELAISIDTQVAGVHFHADADPALIASRTLRCAASDLAAMGAIPLGFTLALTLPAVDEVWLGSFASALSVTAGILQCPLVGGDTTRGPLCISVQVHGAVPAGQALRRSGAQAGEDVWVSGTLGDGAAALALLEGRLSASPEADAFLRQRFYEPDINFALGVQLRGIATACIDVSDGLVADLAHIATASGLAASVHRDLLPMSPLWKTGVTEEQAHSWALTGGDDYRLCFTASVSQRTFLSTLEGLVLVGNMVQADATVSAGTVTVLDKHGVTCDISSHGFCHF